MFQGEILVEWTTAILIEKLENMMGKFWKLEKNFEKLEEKLESKMEKFYKEFYKSYKSYKAIN